MNGDVTDWIDTWRGPLIGLALARGLDRAAAHELAADVFAEAWLGRERFRGDFDDERAFGAWLGGIARNLHRAGQRARTHLPLDDVTVARQPTDEASSDERANENTDVRAAIERLPEAEREVVRMFYLEETSTRRVAALLGLTERAVEGRLRRARERLAGWLAPAADARAAN
ncbi:MAG: sigma-70 family RNA polymerase sigma factor [Planctomycetota bacterium]